MISEYDKALGRFERAQEELSAAREALAREVFKALPCDCGWSAAVEMVRASTGMGLKAARVIVNKEWRRTRRATL